MVDGRLEIVLKKCDMMCTDALRELGVKFEKGVEFDFEFEVKSGAGAAVAESVIALLEELLEVRRRWLGTNHIATLKVTSMLADGLKATGQQLKHLMSTTLGEGGTTAQPQMKDSGHIDLLKQARAHYEHVERQQMKTLGGDDATTLETITKTADTLSLLGQHAQAIQRLAYVRQTQNRALGPLHKTSLDTSARPAHLESCPLCFAGIHI